MSSDGRDVWTAIFALSRFAFLNTAAVVVTGSADAATTFAGGVVAVAVAAGCCCMRHSNEARQEDSRPSSLIEGKWYTSMMSLSSLVPVLETVLPLLPSLLLSGLLLAATTGIRWKSYRTSLRLESSCSSTGEDFGCCCCGIIVRGCRHDCGGCVVTALSSSEPWLANKHNKLMAEMFVSSITFT